MLEKCALYHKSVPSSCIRDFRFNYIELYVNHIFGSRIDSLNNIIFIPVCTKLMCLKLLSSQPFLIWAPCFNLAQRHEGVWGSGVIAPHIHE
jgi:hypothetical protein